MKKTAIYMRVSTTQQAQEGDSIPAQRDALHKYIDSHDDLVFVGEYTDDGVSGTKANRDELQRLLTDVQANKIDLILVTKLDRFYRSIRHYLNTMELLDRHGVGWMAIWEPVYDTTTPQGRLIVNQMMSIAQFEAENTSQRIKSVFAYKASKGEALSGRQPFGYSVVNKHVVPDENADKARMIFNHYAFGASLGETMKLCADLGYYCEMVGLRAMLTNTKYIGIYRTNTNYCPAIISKDVFDRVQHNLSHNIKTNVRHDYIFSSLCKCPLCGTGMVGTRYYIYTGQGEKRTLKTRENAYICASAARAYNGEKCHGLTKYLERQIEQYLLDNMNDIILECEIKQKPIIDNTKQINAINSKLLRLKELYINELIDMDEYKADREKLEAQLAGLDQPVQQTDFDELKKMIDGSFKDLYKTLSNAEKRYLWRSVIKSITPKRKFPKSRSIVCKVDFL